MAAKPRIEARDEDHILSLGFEKVFAFDKKSYWFEKKVDCVFLTNAKVVIDSFYTDQVIYVNTDNLDDKRYDCTIYQSAYDREALKDVLEWLNFKNK